MRFKIIAIGVSWGGMKALQLLLPQLPKNFSIPIVIVQHLGTDSGTEWISILNSMSRIRVDKKQMIYKRKY